jgi:hypothetical protein
MKMSCAVLKDSSRARDRFDRTPIDLALLAGRRAAYERLSTHGATPSPAIADISGSIERAEHLAHFFSACWNDLLEVERMLKNEPLLANTKLSAFFGPTTMSAGRHCTLLPAWESANLLICC